MRKYLIIMSILSMLVACAKKEKWEMSENEYQSQARMCLNKKQAIEDDPRVPKDPECEKFEKYYEQKEGHPLSL